MRRGRSASVSHSWLDQLVVPKIIIVRYKFKACASASPKDHGGSRRLELQNIPLDHRERNVFPFPRVGSHTQAAGLRLFFYVMATVVTVLLICSCFFYVMATASVVGRASRRSIRSVECNSSPCLYLVSGAFSSASCRLVYFRPCPLCCDPLSSSETLLYLQGMPPDGTGDVDGTA